MYKIQEQTAFEKKLSKADKFSLINLLYYFVLCEKALDDNQNVNYSKLFYNIKLYQDIISRYEIVNEKENFKISSETKSKSYIKEYLSEQIEKMYEYVHPKI